MILRVVEIHRSHENSNFHIMIAIENIFALLFSFLFSFCLCAIRLIQFVWFCLLNSVSNLNFMRFSCYKEHMISSANAKTTNEIEFICRCVKRNEEFCSFLSLMNSLNDKFINANIQHVYKLILKRRDTCLFIFFLFIYIIHDLT